MRLLNLTLTPPLSTIEMTGAGHLWDVHNFADFVGLTYQVGSTTAVLRWEAHAPHDRPWGPPENRHRGVELVFHGVSRIQLTERRPDAPRDADLTTESIARVDPGSIVGGHRMYWDETDPCDLAVDLESGQRILIAAESVELRPVA